jgi:6-phosphogluconolactonase
MRHIKVFPDSQTLAHAAAARFQESAANAIAQRGVFTVALAGGSTPRLTYSLLAGEPYRSQIEWGKIQFFWGDERCVPPDHPDSNYRMAWEALLSHIPVTPDHVHRMQGENPDVAVAAAAYAREIRAVIGSDADLPDRGPSGRGSSADLPKFDLVLLGLGPDGHTLSLFPGSAALAGSKELERQDLVVANWVEKFKTWRITMTARLVNHAAGILFQVEGEDKASPLREVLYGTYDPETYPAQLIRPADGECFWFVDRHAAGLLPDSNEP